MLIFDGNFVNSSMFKNSAFNVQGKRPTHTAHVWTHSGWGWIWRQNKTILRRRIQFFAQSSDFSTQSFFYLEHYTR